MPGVLNSSQAFLGIQVPQHLSGQTKVQSFLFPGPLQPLVTVTVLKSSEAFLGIPYPQHLSGQSFVRSFLFPGALQPLSAGLTVLQTVFSQVGAHVTRRVVSVGY